MVRLLFTFFLILFAAMSRLLPHPANFVPITAIALFGGVYLDKKHTFIVPIAALLISDYFIGFYQGWQWVYGSFIAIGFIGLWLRNHKEILPVIGASLTGSLLFFIVTNFGVWVSAQSGYAHNVSGLLECYVAAIPFFRNTLAGDLMYVGVLFGVYELAKKYVPALNLKPTA
jgi:hypothetical protein